MNETLVLVTLLCTKHFLVDFILQTRYQWINKGRYGHPGGILHATLHGGATIICFIAFSGYIALLLGLLDGIIHYHIDWIKENIAKKFQWRAEQHTQFWWLLGLDQFFHMLTYIFLISLSQL